MQAKAIIEAAIEIKKEIGKCPILEIMIPLIFSDKELSYIKNSINEELKLVEEDKGELPKILIGTMIELPRAALLADEIASMQIFLALGRMT